MSLFTLPRSYFEALHFNRQIDAQLKQSWAKQIFSNESDPPTDARFMHQTQNLLKQSDYLRISDRAQKQMTDCLSLESRKVFKALLEERAFVLRLIEKLSRQIKPALRDLLSP